MKSKFKTVRVILYSKKDHVMNTPPSMRVHTF